MSEVKLNIAAGKLESVEVQGRYVFVESADGPVEVTALISNGANDSIILKERQQARFDATFDKMAVRNLHPGSNTVHLMVSHAQLFPGQDGSSVTIAGQSMPLEIETASPLAVVVDDQAPLRVELVDIGVTQPVYMIGGDDVVAGTLTLAPSQVIAASATRGSVRLKADNANTGAVWIGAVDDGYPLAAGESVPVDASAALTLVAAVAGEKVHFILIGSVV